jgi:hypothetical protein
VGIFGVSIRIRKEGKELNNSITHVSSVFGLSLLGLGLPLFASSSAPSVGVFMSLGGPSPDDQATITDAFWEGACKQRVFCMIYGLNPEIWWGLRYGCCCCCCYCPEERGWQARASNTALSWAGECHGEALAHILPCNKTILSVKSWS